MKVVAMIPLRGGSKSIPNKNMKLMAEKPLFWWVTSACRESRVFSSVVVSTESDEIAACVKAHFPDIAVLKRPAELAGDTTSTEAVMLHLADHHAFDYLCTVQATSPLLTAEHLRNGLGQLLLERYDSMVSCVRWRRFLWSSDGQPLNYDPRHRPMRQDNPGVFMENGAFYFTKRAILLTNQCRLGGRIGVFEMPEETAVEVDNPTDWLIVEQLVRQLRFDHGEPPPDHTASV